MPQEIEIKLAVSSARDARRRLKAAGFHVARRRLFEGNTIFDTPKLTLRRSHSVVRLREAGGEAILTYKGPPIPSRHKSREEIESTVEDPRAVRAVLERLGYRAVWRYEKYRTEYKLERGAGTATLDETPIGIYLELEGGPRWIDRMARVLGFTHQDYITASYGRLHMEYCKAHRLKRADMVF